MENILKIEDLSFKYPNSKGYAIKNLSFDVFEGELLLVCGKSGCAKTTLLRLIKNSLAPNGEKNGKIYFDRTDIDSLTRYDECKNIGIVGQNAENQIVTDKVWHEIAFGLENMGIESEEIRRRVSEMASFFGINNWFNKSVDELSGGQKQILNIASVMVMQPKLLLLDEPTQSLDPICAQEVIEAVRRINKELGITVVIAEHRLEKLLDIADSMLVLDNGEMVIKDNIKDCAKYLKEKDHAMFFAMGTPMRVWAKSNDTADVPITVRDGRYWLKEYVKNNEVGTVKKAENKSINEDRIIELKNIYFKYRRDLPDTVKDLNLSINKGEIFAILGGNGEGKTTTLSIMAGLNKPYRGRVLINSQDVFKLKDRFNKTISYLPQNPTSLFSKNSVKEEVLSISDKEKANEMLRLCGLDKVGDLHPYDISGGEQQRLALSMVLLKDPEILLMDEPTKGFDAQFKLEFADILNKLKKDGKTIVMVSHDIEFCASYADRCAMFFDGGVTAVDFSDKFFLSNSFYTTSAVLMSRGIIKDAVTLDDITECILNTKGE